MNGDYQSFINEFTEPVSNCTEFYALYYLHEIKNVGGVEYSFRRKVEKQHKDFWNYGIFAVARELKNLKNSAGERWDYIEQIIEDMDAEMRIRRDYEDDENVSINQLETAIRGPQATKAVINKMLEDKLDLDSHEYDPYEVINDTHDMYVNIQEKETHVWVIDYCERLEEKLGIFSNPEPFIELASELFVKFVWDSFFGGPSWSGVCSSLLTRDELSDVVWVDMMWALQHNTGEWVNKIGYSQDEMEYVAECVRQLPPQAVEGIEEYKRTGDSLYSVGDALQYVLDSKREGDFNKIFPFLRLANESFVRYRGYFI